MVRGSELLSPVSENPCSAKAAKAVKVIHTGPKANYSLFAAVFLQGFPRLIRFTSQSPALSLAFLFSLIRVEQCDVDG
jgi:hypothetical protein